MKTPLFKRLLKFIFDTPEIDDRESKYTIDDIDKTINDLQIVVNCSEKDLANIPETGAFITVSNHPFGGIDGIILLSVLLKKRPDIKLLATDMINKVPMLQSVTLQFDNTRKTNLITVKPNHLFQVLHHLKKGSPLCIFPAGDVSTYSIDSKVTTDRRWREKYLTLIRGSEVPIIPVYIDGTNGNLFQILGTVHPALKTASDLIARRDKNITIRIGTPIKQSDVEDFKGIEKFGRFLRAKTYALDTKLDVPNFFIPRLHTVKTPEPIVQPVDRERIIKDVEQLRKHYLLFSSGKMSVFCTPSSSIPNLLKEIGRLRELTFRSVGEGTNTSMDIDEYDIYYNHLFIWDEENSKIVGAYRVGRGFDIINLYGVQGFYLNSLFKMSSEMLPILKQSLELGRSFIVEEYQRKPLSLFMLWKGILYFLLKHPEYRYLIGPVSISNQFTKFSKNLITKFLFEYHYDNKLAKMVQSRKAFKPNLKFDTEIIIEKAKDDINKIDKIISDAEPNNYKMPVLLKKYLKLNAKIIGFNIDPKFNNALDGLIILDLFEVPYTTIESLSKEVEDDSILTRFNR